MPAAFTVSDDIFVAAPPAVVWDLAGDTRRYPEWVDNTLAVTGGDAQTAAGAVYEERNRLAGPIVLPARWVVTQYDETALMQRHEADDSAGVRDVWLEMRVAPEGDGSRFTLALGATVALGPLSGIAARFLQASLARSNAANVRSFARLAEQLGATGGGGR